MHVEEARFATRVTARVDSGPSPPKLHDSDAGAGSGARSRQAALRQPRCHTTASPSITQLPRRPGEPRHGDGSDVGLLWAPACQPAPRRAGHLLPPAAAGDVPSRHAGTALPSCAPRHGHAAARSPPGGFPEPTLASGIVPWCWVLPTALLGHCKSDGWGMNLGSPSPPSSMASLPCSWPGSTLSPPPNLPPTPWVTPTPWGQPRRSLDLVTHPGLDKCRGLGCSVTNVLCPRSAPSRGCRSRSPPKRLYTAWGALGTLATSPHLPPRPPQLLGKCPKALPSPGPASPLFNPSLRRSPTSSRKIKKCKTSVLINDSSISTAQQVSRLLKAAP